MELVWLEDFVALAATRSFSAAAATRNITQPAFSRRVRSLENWIGAELIDRSTYPVNLTRAGEGFLEACRPLMRDMYRVRDECRQQAATSAEAINVSALHTIALSVYPALVSRVEAAGGPVATRMHATDFYDCIEALSLGRCDLAFCYAHPLGPPVLPSGPFLMRRIAHDPFILVSAPAKGASGRNSSEKAGKPRFRLKPGSAPLPLAAYSPDCFLGKIQAHLVRRLTDAGLGFRVMFESSMSEAIKRIVLAGQGIGWVPRSCVGDELAEGRLVALHAPAPPAELDVMMLRRQPSGSAMLERFWSAVPEV